MMIKPPHEPLSLELLWVTIISPGRSSLRHDVPWIYQINLLPADFKHFCTLGWVKKKTMVKFSEEMVAQHSSENLYFVEPMELFIVKYHNLIHQSHGQKKITRNQRRRRLWDSRQNLGHLGEICLRIKMKIVNTITWSAFTARGADAIISWATAGQAPVLLLLHVHRLW